MVKNIGTNGDLPYIPNRLSPPPLAKGTPSTTPDNIASKNPAEKDQFISNPSHLGNLVASSGLVKLPNEKKGDWGSFAVAVEPEADANANAVLSPLNMKSEATIKLTELPPKGNESVTAEFMKIAGTTGTNGPNASMIASRIINGLAQS